MNIKKWKHIQSLLEEGAYIPWVLECGREVFHKIVVQEHPSSVLNSTGQTLSSRGDILRPFLWIQIQYKTVLLTLLMLLGSLPSYGQQTNPDAFDWESLPELPAPEEDTTQHGLAGAFSGVHNGALMIAGGANFPDEMPWNGGQKVWWDRIYVLERDSKGEYVWHVQDDVNLPRPLAYGVSVSTPNGVICIGGNNEKGVYKEVFRLKWDPQNKRISIDSLPDLPQPLAFMTGAKVGDEIFVAGGMEENSGKATKNFLSLDLSQQGSSSFLWEELSAWPGPARVLSMSSAQSNGNTNSFYLFGGRNVGPDKPTDILTDAYSYNPSTGRWSQLPDIQVDGEKVAAMGAPAIVTGASHIILFGGADGKIFRQLENLDQKIAAAADTNEVSSLRQQKTEILEKHPGFNRQVLAFHTITQTWTVIDSLPSGGAVTTNALRWNESIVIPSGEIRPGVRTPSVIQGTHKKEAAFGWLNYSIVGIYLLLLIGMGIFFSRRESTTDDYFKAGGRIPWWAAGISIFGTQLSAITFMAIPAKTYATDWTYFMLNMTIVMVAPIIVFMFLPFFRRLNVTTAYEYLEKRFNTTARLIGGVMFTALQFGRIGIVLFLPSLALSVVTGIDVSTCILLMGVLSIIYTVLGGIEAVVWTDVIQVTVLVGGALLCLMIIPFNVEGGMGHILETVTAQGKVDMFDFDLDLTTPTFWVVLLGGLAANLISYGSDQAVVQRYLTTSDEKNAARGIWTNALLTIPVTLLFFSVGTALFVFYQDNPQMLDASVNNADAIFPLFIVTQLPNGIAGILIAGIFAAAMSSLDSSMNSVASVVTTDFYQRFNPDASDHNSLKVAKWTTGIVGVSGTAFALVMAGWDIKSLWDQLNTFIGLFAGGLGGVFILGIFTKRTNGIGAVTGLLASGVVQYIVKSFTPLHLLLYTFTGMVSCIIIGYLCSLIFNKQPSKNGGLTIFSLNKIKNQ